MGTRTRTGKEGVCRRLVEKTRKKRFASLSKFERKKKAATRVNYTWKQVGERMTEKEKGTPVVDYMSVVFAHMWYTARAIGGRGPVYA